MTPDKIGSAPTIVEQDIVNDLMTTFFEGLSYPKVEAGDISKADIDSGQEIAEQLVALRISLKAEFTEDELDSMPYKNLQRIAKSFGIKATQSADSLIGELTGQPKSVRPTRQIKAVFARLAEAREVIGYPHPKQG